ncbi:MULTISPECIES: helix-turn-helix domain-containing protein [Paenarthrobacter]|jgi:hypothetical protein|uniref:helix-turn-helix domain-containing protein n=1 Tax=Paenarthrobacter TaxID=1742992 RepID=UPI00223276F7|nr:LysR family transcriptional regulator [Paenarthrobacter sp. PAE-2]MCW3768863.1 LysR family transcriptional regulator [Paenarthrobacter sp. PAE-2]
MSVTGAMKATRTKEDTKPQRRTATRRVVSPRRGIKLRQALKPRNNGIDALNASPRQRPIEAARRAKARRELGSLDYIRSVRLAVEELGQGTVARALGVSQPAISKLLASAEARGVAPVPDGFSGASPYEIAERYAAGDIDRDALIRELSAWPYPWNEGADDAVHELDWMPCPEPPGSFEEVGRAFDEGLIDGDAYNQILDAS